MWNTLGAAMASQAMQSSNNASQYAQYNNLQQQQAYRPMSPSIEEQIERLEYERLKIERELNHLVSHSHLIGPTKHELDEHESLKNAWNEYRTIRTLLGLK